MKRIALLLITVVTIAGVGSVTVPASLHAYQAATPIFVTQISSGYRGWRLISVTHEEDSLNSFVAVLGNDVAIKAYREGKVPFPGADEVRELGCISSSGKKDRSPTRPLRSNSWIPASRRLHSRSAS